MNLLVLSSIGFLLYYGFSKLHEQLHSWDPLFEQTTALFVSNHPASLGFHLGIESKQARSGSVQASFQGGGNPSSIPQNLNRPTLGDHEIIYLAPESYVKKHGEMAFLRILEVITERRLLEDQHSLGVVNRDAIQAAFQTLSDVKLRKEWRDSRNLAEFWVRICLTMIAFTCLSVLALYLRVYYLFLTGRAQTQKLQRLSNLRHHQKQGLGQGLGQLPDFSGSRIARVEVDPRWLRFFNIGTTYRSSVQTLLMFGPELLGAILTMAGTFLVRSIGLILGLILGVGSSEIEKDDLESLNSRESNSNTHTKASMLKFTEIFLGENLTQLMREEYYRYGVTNSDSEESDDEANSNLKRESLRKFLPLFFLEVCRESTSSDAVFNFRMIGSSSGSYDGDDPLNEEPSAASFARRKMDKTLTLEWLVKKGGILSIEHQYRVDLTITPGETRGVGLKVKQVEMGGLRNGKSDSVTTKTKFVITDVAAMGRKPPKKLLESGAFDDCDEDYLDLLGIDIYNKNFSDYDDDNTGGIGSVSDVGSNFGSIPPPLQRLSRRNSFNGLGAPLTPPL